MTGIVQQLGLTETLDVRQKTNFALVVFGITGDLAKQKIIPSIFTLFLKNLIKDFQIVGFARRPWTQEQFEEEILNMLTNPGQKRAKQRFLKHFIYVESTFESEKGYQQLVDILKPYQYWTYYLSTPPSEYSSIVSNLGKFDLAQKADRDIQIIVEKPFGHDLESAKQLNQVLADGFRESQIYRIDHYMGKEVFQNIPTFRYHNALIENIWNKDFIDYIEIVAAEKDGILTRANYFDPTGLVRDMIQSHLLQVMALLTMELPEKMESESVRHAKNEILSKIQVINENNFSKHCIIGQYSASEYGKGYLEEEGVPSDSHTETYAAIKVFLDSPRWDGVPIYLRVGKGLTAKTTEVVVTFKGNLGDQDPLRLVMRAQPQEGIILQIKGKFPGGSSNMVIPMPLSYIYTKNGWIGYITDYEYLIFEALQRHSIAFLHKKAIEQCWKFVDSLEKAMKKNPVYSYPVGSQGPKEAETILSKGHRFIDLSVFGLDHGRV